MAACSALCRDFQHTLQKPLVSADLPEEGRGDGGRWWRALGFSRAPPTPGALAPRRAPHPKKPQPPLQSRGSSVGRAVGSIIVGWECPGGWEALSGVVGGKDEQMARQSAVGSVPSRQERLPSPPPAVP